MSQLKSWKVTPNDSKEEELLSDESLEDGKEEDNPPKKSLLQPKSLNTKAVTERDTKFLNIWLIMF